MERKLRNREKNKDPKLLLLKLLPLIFVLLLLLATSSLGSVAAGDGLSQGGFY